MARAYPMRPGRQSTVARCILSGEVEQIPDVLADPEYAVSQLAKAATARSVSAVPLLKQGRPVGGIASLVRYPEGCLNA